MVFERKRFAREMVSNCIMLELQRIRFAGWALTEGQHRPKAGKKKKTAKPVFFFWFPLRFSDASSRSGLADFCPRSNIYLSPFIPTMHGYITSGSTAPGASPCRHGRKVGLAKRSSERLTRARALSTLNFEILI